MSQLLDSIRALRETVVVRAEDIERSCQKKKPKRRKKKAKGAGFAEWRMAVEEKMEDLCGMGTDILGGGVDWRMMYRQGWEPHEAVVTLLEIAEGEDEEEDEASVGKAVDMLALMTQQEDDSYGELEEFSMGKLTYNKWIKKLDKIFRKQGTTFMAVKTAARITNPMLHSIYMSQVSVDKAAQMLAYAVQEGVEEKPSLRRRRFRVDIKKADPLASLEKEYEGVLKKKSSGNDMYEQIMRYMDEVSEKTPAAKKVLPPKQSAPKQKSSGTITTQSEDMAAAMSSVQEVIVQERADKAAFIAEQKRRQQQDEDNRALLKQEEDNRASLKQEDQSDVGQENVDQGTQETENNSVVPKNTAG